MVPGAQCLSPNERREPRRNIPDVEGGLADPHRAGAQEARGTGITVNAIAVNAIAPMVITRMNRDAFLGGAESQGDSWQEDIRRGAAPMRPASSVSPTVLWLAHRSTRVNGDIYSTSSGKVARVGFMWGRATSIPITALRICGKTLLHPARLTATSTPRAAQMSWRSFRNYFADPDAAVSYNLLL